MSPIERRIAADGVAERPVEGRGIFCRIGHDLRIEETLGIEAGADRRDPAVHHVGRRDDIGAGAGLVQRLADEHRDGLVVEDGVAAQQSVVAMARIGVERDIGDEADGGRRGLDRAAGAAHEIVGIQRLAALGIAPVGIGIGEEREGGNAEPLGAQGLADRLVDGEPLDAGHRGHLVAALVAVDEENRPDQIVGRQNVFTRQATRPLGLAVAARAMDQIEARWHGATSTTENRKRKRPAGRAPSAKARPRQKRSDRRARSHFAGAAAAGVDGAGTVRR